MINFDYIYNPNAAKPFFDINYFVDKKLGFSIIENGMILPHKRNIPEIGNRNGGGIVDSNGEYIKSSFWHYGLGRDYTPPPPRNQFNVAQKLLFISECFFMFGDILLRIIFVVCGFCKAKFLKMNSRIVR